MLLWLVCGSAFVMACLALRRARALARRLDRVKQVQWELSYQVDALTARIETMRPGERPAAGRAGDGAPDAASAAVPSDAAFVPLSSVRRN